MKFQINLDPLSAPLYFTAQEHLRKFDTQGDVQEYLKLIEESLRQFLSLTSTHQFSIIPRSEKENFLQQLSPIIYVDNPYTGRNELKDHHNLATQIASADVSYSFPQCAHYDISGFGDIIFDTSASLGVPTSFLVVFSKDANRLLQQHISLEFSKEIYVLSKVLDDLEEKKMEILLRESNYKAAVLYQLLDSHQNLSSVVDRECRSKTVITADCEPDFADRIEGLGYRLYRQELAGKVRLTIANYATQSKELIEMFADRVSEL